MNHMCSLFICLAFTLTPTFAEESCSAANGGHAKKGNQLFQQFKKPQFRSKSWEGGDGLIIPLRRTKLIRVNATKTDQDVFFYVGNVTVGYPPQKLSVLFDTASGNAIMPHRLCKTKACLAHTRYSSWSSSTSEDVFSNGTRIKKNQRLIKGKHQRDGVSMSFTAADLGDGFVRGPYVKDRVCVADVSGNKVCATPVMVAALKMDDTPFQEMPNDAILGLSLAGLSVSGTFNFLDSLIANRPKLKSQFAITFNAEGGELHVGGYNPSQLANPLQWFPVHEPHVGYWQVPILSVRVGDTVVDSCQNGCHAVMDTGTSRIGVQKGHLPRVRSTLAASVHGQSCQGPNLVFDLGGMSIEVKSQDYTDKHCNPDLGPLDLEEPEYHGVYTFGEVVLRHYFVVCDWQRKLMGFAPVKPAAGARLEQAFV